MNTYSCRLDVVIEAESAKNAKKQFLTQMRRNQHLNCVIEELVEDGDEICSRCGDFTNTYWYCSEGHCEECCLETDTGYQD